jgi:pyrroline-5-carboxylate reductase
MSPSIPPILLIGGGKMGAALLAGWLERGAARIAVIDPAPQARSLAGPGVAVYAGVDLLPGDFRPEVLILAVKPQLAADVLPAYRGLAAGALVISIMAGQTVAGLRALLGPDAAIVRAMPNTPAAIGQGITVATPVHGLGESRRALATALLGAVGEVAWIEDEMLIDAVTAVSGSGPAYVFLLAECMEQAGIKQGLPPDLARRLARRTVTGAGNLLAASADSAAVLRQNVTSPGGTTAAALEILQTVLPAAFEDAISAATARSRKLSAGRIA